MRAAALLALLPLTACLRFDVEPRANRAPVPALQAERSALVGETVLLDASATADPDGDALAYRWEQVEGTGDPVTLKDADKAVASFVAPERPQQLFFRFVASDGAVESAPAAVRVVVALRPNAAPVAVLAKAELEALTGATVVLDASGSHDDDGDPLAFSWAQVGTNADPVALLDADKAVATFAAPDRPQRLFFAVTVSDGIVAAAPAVVRVDVRERPNVAPAVRVASDSLTAVVGSTVVLDASTTTDADNDALTYRWVQLTSAGSEPVALVHDDQPVASFTAPDRPQRLYFQVTASDGLAEARQVVRVEVTDAPNEAPVARVAQPEIAAVTGATVVLDAAASSDGDDDPLLFRWEQVGEGADPVTLRNPDGAVATFVAPDRAQRLFFAVTVSDAKVSAAPLVVRVDVAPPPNRVPLALPAALEIDTTTGVTVVLDGSGSSDPDGDAISYHWEQIATSGEPIALQGAATAVATFRAPDVGQRLFFRLVVRDGRAESLPAVVRVAVNSVPFASAGAPRSVPNGTGVLLEGTGWDRDGDVVATWRWRVTSAPAGGDACLEEAQPCLFGRDSASVTFTPVAKGDFVLSLVVGDGRLESLPSTVVVRSLNRPPRAVASTSTPTVPNGATLTLSSDGSSDADGDAVTGYRWSIASLPSSATATFSPAAANVPGPTLRVQGKGSYFVSLVVVDSDGGESDPATLRVEVVNGAPQARVGADVQAPNGTEVSLLGTGTDPDNDTLAHAWRLVDAPPDGRVTLLDADRAQVRFTPSRRTLQTEPALCQTGQCYVLEYRVSDGVLESAPARVVVTSLNRRPIADAGADLVNPPLPVMLNASLSRDPDGDVLAAYRWTQLGGPDVTGGVGYLVGLSPSFTPPDAAAYSFDLVVSDGVTDSLPDRFIVQVGKVNEAPVLALASTRVVAAEGTAFDLDASATTDPDQDPVTVIWRRREGSTLFPASLVGPTPHLVAPAFADVLDDTGNSATYEVTATDGRMTSPPESVRLYVAPGAGFVIVSNDAAATDAASDCGSLEVPCASVKRAIQQIDPDGNGQGDGRSVVLASGLYRHAYVNGALRWPGGARLIGARDPVTFAPGLSSEIRTDTTCGNVQGALELPASAVNVILQSVRLSIENTGCAPQEKVGLLCENCRATLRDVEVSSVTAAWRVQGIAIYGAAARVTMERVRVTASRSSLNYTWGVSVAAGAEVSITDSTVTANVADTTPHAALMVDAAAATVRRSRLVVNGLYTGYGERGRGVYSTGGNVVLESTVVVNSSHANGFGVQHGSGGNLVMLGSTVVGTGAAAGSGAGVHVTEAVSLAANLVTDFARPLNLGSASALRSRVFGNAWVTTGTAPAVCNGTDAALADLNAASGTTCNASGMAWSDNLAARCPLVNPAGGDYHLNTGVANPCLDAAPATTPAGNLPGLDLDGTLRPSPAGGRGDIGADEA